MELLKINPGYYKFCRSASMRRKHSSNLQDVGTTEKTLEGVALFQKKKHEDKNIETEGASYEKGSF